MPFLEDTDMTPRSGYNPRVYASSTYEPSFFEDIIPASFRLDNTIGSWGASRDYAQAEFDPTFDPFEYMRDTDNNYIEQYAETNSFGDVLRLQSQIDRENRDRATLAAGGAYSFAAGLLMGVADPINLIPIGGAAYRGISVGSSLLEGAARTGLAGMVGSGTAEMLLHQTQVTRTAEESMYNIAGGTILSGILGGAVSGAATGMRRAGVRKTIDQVVSDIERDMRIQPSEGSVGAAAVNDLDDVTRARIRQEVQGLADRGEISVDDVDFRVAEKVAEMVLYKEGVAGDTLVQNVLNVVRFQDPTLRLLTASDADARRLSTMIGETPLELGKNEMGIASAYSVEALARGYRAPQFNATKYLREQYVEYMKGRSSRFTGANYAMAEVKALVSKGDQGRLTPAGFREAVGRAMNMGDLADSLDIPADAKPFVTKVAKQYRDTIFEPMKREAIKVGLFDPEVEVTDAISYFTRVWDKDILVEGNTRNRFLDVVSEWLAGRQREALARTEAFPTEEADLKNTLAELRQRIRTTGEATRRGTQQGAQQATIEKVNEALEGLSDRLQQLEDMIPEGVSEDKAASAAKRAFYRTLSRELQDEVKQEVLAAIDEVAGDILDAITRVAADASDDEIAAAIRKDLAEAPLTGEAGSIALDVVNTRIDTIMDEAFIAAKKAYDRSVVNQQKRIDDLINDPEARQAAFIAEVKSTVGKAARREADRAARAATKDLREELVKVGRDLAKRRKVHARDLFEVDMSRQELRDLAEQIHSRIVNTGEGRISYDINPKRLKSKGASQSPELAGSLQGRAFKIPYELIEEFLVHDVEQVTERYIRSVAPDIELVRKFGDITLEDEFKKIERNYNQKMSADPTNASKLQAEYERVIRDLAAMRDRVRGTYGLPKDAHSIPLRASRAVRQLNYIRLLGGQVISAIPDIARLVMVPGMERAFGDIVVPLMTNWQGVKKISKDISELGLASDMITNSRMHQLGNIADDFGRRSKFEKALGAMSDTFGMVTLMAPWNTAMKQMAGIVTMQRLIRNIDALDTGKISKKERKFMASVGIDENNYNIIKKALDKHRQTEGGLQLANAAAWVNEDFRAYQMFQASMQREVDRIIITPGMDRPLAADTEIGRHLLQFKSFAIASTQRILLSGLQQRDMATLNGLWMAVALGSLTSAIKMIERGDGEKLQHWNTAKWIVEGVDRSGVTGWAFEVNNALEKLSGGIVGLNALTDGGPSSRYTSRNIGAAFFGPTIGTVNSIAGSLSNFSKVMAGEDELRQSDIHGGFTLLPYYNVPPIRKALGAVENAIGDYVGAKQ